MDLFNSKFEEANQAYVAKNYDEALLAINDANTILPNRADVSNFRGLVYLKQNSYPNAQAAFEAAVKQNPTWWTPQYNLAELFFEQKDYANAQSRYEALLSSQSATASDSEIDMTRYKIFLSKLFAGDQAQAEQYLQSWPAPPQPLTPARGYAQIALDIQNKNFIAAQESLTSARNAYPAPMNIVFAQPLYYHGLLAKDGTVITSDTVKTQGLANSTNLNQKNDASSVAVISTTPASSATPKNQSLAESVSANAKTSPTISASPANVNLTPTSTPLPSQASSPSPSVANSSSPSPSPSLASSPVITITSVQPAATSPTQPTAATSLPPATTPRTSTTPPLQAVLPPQQKPDTNSQQPTRPTSSNPLWRLIIVGAGFLYVLTTGICMLVIHRKRQSNALNSNIHSSQSFPVENNRS